MQVSRIRIVTTLGILSIGLAVLVVIHVSRVAAKGKNAPQIGQRAPDFSLVDANGRNFSLAQLFSTPITSSGRTTRPTKGVLLVFYRGYW